MKKTLSLIISVIIIIAFTVTSLGLTTIAVKSIKLNASNVSISVGKTYKLKVDFTPTNATNKKVTFSSTNKSIATVSSTGYIKGVMPGKTVITVTSASNKKAVAKCNVTIKQIKTDIIKVFTWDNDNSEYGIRGGQPVIEYAMKKTNVKIEWQLANMDELTDKITLLIAGGGDMPDLFVATPRNITPQEMAQKGVIIPFGDMIDSGKMPLTKAALNTEKLKSFKSELKQADGKIYYLAVCNDTSTLIWNMLIRKDWMNKLGINKLPDTIDEYTEVLRKMVNGDANGNGQADEIGWTNFMGGTGWIGMWYPSFGINTQNYFSWDPNWGMENGKYYFIKTSPKYKKLLGWLNKVYKEKLIDNEVFTTDSPKFIAKVPVMASMHHWLRFNMVYAEQLKTDLKDDKIAYYSMLWPLAEGVTERTYVQNGQAMWYTYLAKKGKNSAAAARFVDYIFGDPEFNKIAQLGLEGVHYKEADGKIKYIGKWADMDEQTRYYALGSMLGRLPGNWSTPELQIREISTAPKFEGVREFQKLIKTLMKPLPTYKFTADQQNTINDATKDLNTYTDEMVTGFVTGKISFDKWDEYVKEVEKIAGDKIKKAITTYEEYYGKNLK